MKVLENAVDASEVYTRLVRTASYQPATDYWRAVELDAALRHSLPAGRGLDLGCGDGKPTQGLTQGLPTGSRRSWIGVHPAPAETVLAERIGLYEAVHTCGGDSIPERAASFGYAFSYSAREHNATIEPVIAEVARGVLSAGRLVFTVLSAAFHSCLRAPFLGAPSEQYFRRIDARCADERYWGVAEWMAGPTRHGFDLVADADDMGLRQTRRWETLPNVIGDLLYRPHGNRIRQIGIQRRRRMRRAEGGLIDWAVAGISRIALMGADPRSGSASRPHAYLLIEAIRR